VRGELGLDLDAFDVDDALETRWTTSY